MKSADKAQVFVRLLAAIVRWKLKWKLKQVQQHIEVRRRNALELPLLRQVANEVSAPTRVLDRSRGRSYFIIPTIVGRTIVGFVVACLYETEADSGEEFTHLEKAKRAFAGGVGVSGGDQSELCGAD